MQRTIAVVMLALMAALSACDRGPNRAGDTTLNTDLSLAAQQRGFQPFDSLGPAERAAGGAAISGAPIATKRRPTTLRSAAGDVARPSRASGSTRGGSSTSATQSSRGTVEKHTKRDAAIGAAAGAIIGATTSRDKVKGGLIGAAVGGILGGVIGNNVDVKKKKP